MCPKDCFKCVWSKLVQLGREDEYISIFDDVEGFRKVAASVADYDLIPEPVKVVDIADDDRPAVRYSVSESYLDAFF